MSTRRKIKITTVDYERIERHIRGAHTMFPWLRSNPSEEDLWMAYEIERTRPNPRCLLLQRLLGHAQKAERHRELAEYGCPSC